MKLRERFAEVGFRDFVFFDQQGLDIGGAFFGFGDGIIQIALRNLSVCQQEIEFGRRFLRRLSKAVKGGSQGFGNLRNALLRPFG